MEPVLIEQALIVMTNVPDLPTAQTIALYLIENKLAACVNYLPGVKSVYRWGEAVEEAIEVSMTIKTTLSRYAELEVAIKSLHPYQVPEIIAVPIACGWQPYLDWIVKETKKDLHV